MDIICISDKIVLPISAFCSKNQHMVDADNLQIKICRYYIGASGKFNLHVRKNALNEREIPV